MQNFGPPPGFFQIVKTDYEAFITGIVMAFLIIIALILLQPAFLIIAGPMILWMAGMLIYRVVTVRKIFARGALVRGTVVKVGKPKGRFAMQPVREIGPDTVKGVYVLLFEFEHRGQKLRQSTRVRYRPGLLEAKPGDEFDLIVLDSKPKHFLLKKIWF